MLKRSLLAATGVAAAMVLALPVFASADPAPTTSPAPPPPLPNVNAYPPISPVPYAVNDGTMYLFAGPAGVQCAINRQSGGYGCSGALPGAPDGANLVSGGPAGAPSFSTTERPMFGTGGAKPLPPNTRLSFREISCGVDGGGALACVNSRDQVGFVVSAAGSYIDDVIPLLDRPEGTSPFLPGMPG
jgi:hypothetical protein